MWLQVAEPDHLVERVVAAELVVVGAHDGVIERGSVQHPRERRRLQDGEGARVLAEVGLGGGFGPVGSVAEVDGIEVFREDLLLRENVLQLHREQRLTDLLPDGARGVDVGRRSVGVADVGPRVDVLHELFGDRGRPLRALAVDEVGPCGADDALEVDPVVRVEAGVLGGDHRVLEVRRDLRQVHDLAVDRAVQRREHVSVTVVEVGGLDRGEGLRQLDPFIGDHERAEHGARHERGDQDEQPPESAEEAPSRLGAFGGGVSGDVSVPGAD